MTRENNWLDRIRWNVDGLLPVVVQDAENGKILMLAWMNREALQQTVACGEAVYWSRSRKRLWHKGESSGHVQRVRDIRLDCDADTLLLQVEQVGGIACHTGRNSCFYLQYGEGDWHEAADEPVLKAPDEIYGES